MIGPARRLISSRAYGIVASAAGFDDGANLIGVCRLEDGPTGPVSKDVWGPQLQ